MSAELEPHAALEEHLGWARDTVECRRLDGGLTNRSYSIRHGGEHYVLRLNAPHTEAIALDRERELRVLTQASAAGVGPEVQFSAPAEGVLLTHYVSGRTWSAGDLLNEKNMDLVSTLLHRVHDLPLVGSCYEPADIAREYAQRFVDSETLREPAERSVSVVVRCSSEAAGFESRCCHNDVVAQNLVGSPRPTLIDWEYACDYDPFFDLASLLSYHGLGDSVAARWLISFSGSTAPEYRERLQLQRKIYDGLYWLWLAARQVTTPSAKQRAMLELLGCRIEKY